MSAESPMAARADRPSRHLSPLDAPGDEIAFRCQRCDQWIYNYGPWETEQCPGGGEGDRPAACDCGASTHPSPRYRGEHTSSCALNGEGNR